MTLLTCISGFVYSWLFVNFAPSNGKEYFIYQRYHSTLIDYTGWDLHQVIINSITAFPEKLQNEIRDK
jgi:hypothetical protein